MVSHVDKPTGQVILKAGREKPVRNRHPWVFSGAIARIEGMPADGDIVDVLDTNGAWLARGYLNRRSQIRVRLLSWDRRESLDRDFWRRRLSAAAERRARLATDPDTNAYRLVHAESDCLPGLVVDRYSDWLVVQSLTLGTEARRALFTELMQELWSPAGIVERSDVDVRRHEGLQPRVALLGGNMVPPTVQVREHGHLFLVDVMSGQKTGFYLDQRENRQRVGALCAGQRVLNGFAYTGGFAVYALDGGATHVTNVDSSHEALQLAERNLDINGFTEDRYELIAGDMFQVLRDWRDRGRAFDVIVLDPPKFAHRKRQVEAAARGYKDINLLALQLLTSGGILATFSCSGAISADLFQKILFGASVDAGRNVQIIGRMGQSEDHPVLLSFPEGEYLKGLLLRVI
ncbi:MAG TPA: class I SAM-dependent rRNA methyltransferase [Anaerolineae bacterium]|nr:class I SAM-dependent rRNA methyltransferase [Anaerolineae bacterium]HIQ04306.1 class I SAM-dependent rRNA methyltransferase [Anaerolineae bacterium]